MIMKKICCILLALVGVFSLSACKKLDESVWEDVALINENASFEFKLLEDVTKKDFSGYIQGKFDRNESWGPEEWYIGSAYSEEDGKNVRYFVGKFPEVKRRARIITAIKCEDRDVTFLGGLTLKSGSQAIRTYLEENGFEVIQEPGSNIRMHLAYKGPLQVIFAPSDLHSYYDGQEMHEYYDDEGIEWISFAYKIEFYSYLYE